VRRTTVWLADEERQALREHAWRTGQTMSEVIREGLRKVLGDDTAPESEDVPDSGPFHDVEDRAPDGWIFNRREELVIALANVKRPIEEIAQEIRGTTDDVTRLRARIEEKYAILHRRAIVGDR
jgi:Arc/MetJ-type ribon-helix-helix transcriptional regulator